jgi:ketol-acid reductoisomerase
MTTLHSSLFDMLDIELAGSGERVLVGGRHLFPLLSQAFRGISRIGVIGWGPQGRAQALNLRESLARTDITVAVGLRAGSTSFARARAEGFSEADGTLGEMCDVIRDSDLVILLVAERSSVCPTAICSLTCRQPAAHFRLASR